MLPAVLNSAAGKTGEVSWFDRLAINLSVFVRWISQAMHRMLASA